MVSKLGVFGPMNPTLRGEWGAQENPSDLNQLEDVQKEKEYFASVIRNFRNGMLTTDNDLNIVYSNLAVERLLGFAAEELQGMKFSDLIQAKETTVRNILEQGGLCVDPKTGELGEFSFITKAGNVFPVEACFSVITDADANVCGMSCTFRDVTQKKRMERALARMDRLASLGELASGMAHEIKNPLACIAGVVQNLTCADSDSCAGMIPEILLQVKRIDEIINSLLHFAKPGPATLQLLQVTKILKSTILLVERNLQDNEIELRLDLNAGDPMVMGDELLLQQVLLNVIMNACEALTGIESKRVLAVNLTCQKSLDPGVGEDHSGSFEYAEIEITDNGPGIGSAELDSIFNPFFTTKHTGAGLGLATSLRIMEEHEGTITVHSESGVGATFRLSLPIFTRSL